MSVSLDSKSQYYLNVHTIQSDLQTQFNPYQNFSDIFHENGDGEILNFIEPQRTPDIQINLEQKEQIGRLKY
jgi:hypothetical protein